MLTLLAASEPLISATAAILGSAAVVAALLVGVGRLAWSARDALGGVKDSITGLQSELAEQRRTDGLDLRREMDAKIARHAAACPAREPTGVRAVAE